MAKMVQTIPSDAQSVPAWIGKRDHGRRRFFLRGPDEVQRPTREDSQRSVRDADALDELQIFVTYRPAWVGADGFPLSWQHYLFGLKHIAREGMRHQLWLAQATRMADVVQDDWVAWQRDIEYMTEVPLHGRQ